MTIRSVKALRSYLYKNSGFAEKTVNNVIVALGYPLCGSNSTFKELSSVLIDCANHGAQTGFNGFTTTKDTLAFFFENRLNIVSHMEKAAIEFDTDIISMVQNFGIFRNAPKPAISEVGRALWCSTHDYKLTSLYNLFTWYALEEISHTWYRYLEDNPAYFAELSA
jgi:hypothetical protein